MAAKQGTGSAEPGTHRQVPPERVLPMISGEEWAIATAPSLSVRRVEKKA